MQLNKDSLAIMCISVLFLTCFVAPLIHFEKKRVLNFCCIVCSFLQSYVLTLMCNSGLSLCCGDDLELYQERRRYDLDLIF